MLERNKRPGHNSRQYGIFAWIKCSWFYHPVTQIKHPRTKENLFKSCEIKGTVKLQYVNGNNHFDNYVTTVFCSLVIIILSPKFSLILFHNIVFSVLCSNVCAAAKNTLVLYQRRLTHARACWIFLKIFHVRVHRLQYKISTDGLDGVY